MERDVCFDRKPGVMAWGERAAVALGARQTGEGVWTADVVYGVELPVSAEGILKAAVEGEFTPGEQQAVLLGSAGPELKARFAELTARVREQAAALLEEEGAKGESL